MTLRGLTLALVGAIAAAVIAGAAYGSGAARETLEILTAVGALTVISVRTLIVRRNHAGGLRRQVLLSALLVIGQLLVAVGLLAWLMLVSHMDVLFTLLVVAYSSVIGLWAARALAARVIADIDAVRSGLARVGEGARDVQIRTTACDELAELARDVELMTEKLSAEEQAHVAADSARRDLLAAVSHDLRTPLTSIQVLAEALDDEIVDAPNRREYMSRIAVHVRALGTLIDDLFELSRIEAGEIRWTMEQVELAELMEETLDAMRPQATARSIEMRFDCEDRSARARANPEQIQRVLFNLLHNAIRHTPADGSVTVRTKQRFGGVEIEVADTGEGINPLDRETVFDAFVQGRSRGASRSNGSAGLGLAIARAIVEAHGGRIWLANGHGGTRVRFSLPQH